MMKKGIAVLLIAVMALSLVACAGKNLSGLWEVTEATGEKTENLIGTTLEFKGNNFIWKSGKKNILTGIFRTTGNTLYLGDDKETVAINGNFLTLKDGSGELKLVRSVEGSWVVKSADGEETENLADAVMEFKKNGTFTLKSGKTKLMSGKYTFDGTTLEYDGVKAALTFDGNRMTLKNDTQTIIFEPKS